MNYYLTFIHNNFRYAVPAQAVKEIFFLPEITPIPEAPADIIGAVNLRGSIIPIMDLNLRFGYETARYSVNDNIIILNWQELTLGVLANGVSEVKAIDESAITRELSHDRPLLDFKQEKFITGYIQEQDNLLLLLDLEALLRYTEAQELNLDLDLDALEDLEITPEITEEEELRKSPVFFPDASEHERKILQKRADNLRQSLRLKDFTGLKPVAVFSLNQEFFGVDLSLVQEFIKFGRVTPIPCTPPFIAGNINLRGEIVTIVDIRSLFNLSRAIGSGNSQAMIVNVEGVIVGLSIDSVHDILMLDPQKFLPASTWESEVGSRAFGIDRSYLEGVLPYQDRMLGLVNLTEIILGGSLLVDEAI